MTNLFKACVVSSVMMLIVGCGVFDSKPPPVAEESGEQGPSVLLKSYKMNVGDQISVVVWKNAELSVQGPIRPDGKFSIPLVGDVIAAGKEPEQLAADVTGSLSTFVRNPHVTVIVTGMQQTFLSRIRITGAVGKDVSIPYQYGMTVLDAVLEAGSIDLYADANRTKLHRKTAEGPVTYTIRLKDIMEDGDMTTNIRLIPGDSITVPERLF